MQNALKGQAHPDIQPEVDNRPSWDVPKIRNCLRCTGSFESEWSGERICGACKKSQAWRLGNPASTQTTSGRK